MYIKTKEFNLTEKQFRQVIALQYFKRMKNLFIILSILAIITLTVSCAGARRIEYMVSLIFTLYYFASPIEYMNIRLLECKKL